MSTRWSLDDTVTIASIPKWPKTYLPIPLCPRIRARVPTVQCLCKEKGTGSGIAIDIILSPPTDVASVGYQNCNLSVLCRDRVRALSASFVTPSLSLSIPLSLPLSSRSIPFALSIFPVYTPTRHIGRDKGRPSEQN